MPPLRDLKRDSLFGYWYKEDPVVHRYLTCWMNGMFHSYEDMLTQLVCALALQKKEMISDAIVIMSNVHTHVNLENQR